MAASDAMPVPIKNQAYRITFPIYDNDGDLVTGAAGLDSEVSKDAGTFADCTNEATEIATSSGLYYLDLTATEMNADTVAIKIKSTTTDSKDTVLVLHPQEAGDIPVDVQSISGDSTAADNCESFFDGTGYAGTGNTIPTVTTLTGHTAQTGDSYARLGAPAGASIAADIATVAGHTDDIGVAGAGLTAVPWNSAWDAEVQSEVADALTAFWTSPATLVDLIWDEDVDTSHQTAGTAGKKLDDAGAGGDPWSTSLPGAYGAGTAGYILGTQAADGSGLTEAGGTGDHLTAIPWNSSWDAEVQSEVQDAIEVNHLDHLLAVDYDPASKPGTSTALLNELVESDSGVSRFTSNALEEAPSGGGGGDATAANQTTIINHLTDVKGTGFAKDTHSLTDILADVTGLAGDAMRGTDSAMLATEDGSSFSAIPWSSAWDAEVQSEVTDALNAYDPPTKAELDSGFAALNDPTAAAVADAVWEEAQADHASVGTFGEIATEIASVLVDTAEIGAAGAGLTAIPWNAAWDAEVQSEVEDGITAQEDNIAAALLDLADGVETGATVRQTLRAIAAIAAGQISGAGSGTETVKGLGTATTRVTATVDASGNRTAMVLNL